MKGKLLEKTQLEGFLGASDIRAITSVLSRTVYGEQIREPLTENSGVDLPRIEHGLKQDLILSYIKILTFLRGKPARFLEALLGKFELLNLKSIIRVLARGSDVKDQRALEPFIFSLRKYHTIPIEDALKAADLESCISLMRNTPFARPLEIGYQRYKTDGQLFPLEIALDLDYYEKLWRALDDLGPLDKHNAGRFLGIQYDMINLIWILRFKRYYNLPPEQIFQYIIPYGWKIKRDIAWKIAEDSDVTGVSPYDDLIKSVAQVDSNPIMGIELTLLRYLYRECLEVFMKFPLQAAPLLAFFIIKEMEIRDIITILAGKNLGLPQERIRSYTITL